MFKYPLIFGAGLHYSSLVPKPDLSCEITRKDLSLEIRLSSEGQTDRAETRPNSICYAHEAFPKHKALSTRAQETGDDETFASTATEAPTSARVALIRGWHSST
jgi:hypothetical protein